MIDYDMNSKPKLLKQFAVPLFPFFNENVGIWLHRRRQHNVNENLTPAHPMLYLSNKTYLVHVVIFPATGWAR